jgi:hypothetical protein
MKSRSRIAVSALALLFVLSAGPVSAITREGDREQSPIVRVLKAIGRFFGVQTDDEFPGPPKP